MKLVLAIAAGGAIGAVLRHYVSHGMVSWLGDGFPYGTLTVNVAGSFILGMLVAAFAHVWSPGEYMQAFLTVGMMGALTTFSTFSLDTAKLAQGGQLGLTALYIVLSVSLAIGALFGGLALGRAVFAS